MKEKSVKVLRTQSLLKELVPEALASLGNQLLSGLCVTEVLCSRGKYDAKVYLDPMFYTLKEQNEIIQELKKAKSQIQNYCLQHESWYRCPNMQFEFDNLLEHQNKMDKLFAQIEKEIGKSDDK